MRRSIATAGPWHTEHDLSRAAAILKPSIRDRLKKKWLLSLADQKRMPEKAAPPTPQPKNRTSGAQEEGDTDTAEELDSNSDDDLAMPHGYKLSEPLTTQLGVIVSNGQTASARREVVVISDDEPEEASQPSLASEVGPTTLPDDETNGEDHQEQVEDIGRQFANRSISARGWKNLCRMFQCQEDIKEHMPVGFKLSISSYQLHAIWWQITQFPVRGVPGGCLGDEMGLGKTIEVLSVFVVFALIKMNFDEVQDYWENNLAVDGREHLPSDQESTSNLDCPSQHNSPYGLLCSCVKSGETYLVVTKLPSLPTICFAPPSSIHGWRREFEKLIDRKNPIMTQIDTSEEAEEVPSVVAFNIKTISRGAVNGTRNTRTSSQDSTIGKFLRRR
ncbi:hypothetical protein F5Y19DRAFT_30004 [Xylariaceae sp. FL1651]|nr:hypothetical protein F5Y19DRAFT_30004 [Xylariaceae sp. FL1651]